MQAWLPLTHTVCFLSACRNCTDAAYLSLRLADSSPTWLLSNQGSKPTQLKEWRQAASIQQKSCIFWLYHPEVWMRHHMHARGINQDTCEAITVQWHTVRACTGRNVPQEKTFSIQADVWVVVVVAVVRLITALRGSERMTFHCWPFSIEETCGDTLGHNKMDRNTNIRLISFPSIYSSLKTIWRCGGSANMWLWFILSSKTPFKLSQVIILNKSQGQEYDTAYIKGENLFPAYTTTCA